MEKEKTVFETRVGERTLRAEFTKLAPQTNGSVLVQYGETVVLANAVMSKRPKENASYFPLTVDYEEKFYAAGRIPGSRFLRREARPSENAILTSRFIDRAIRPLFDHRMRYEIQITVLALSADGENDPDMPAMFGASLALLASDIPWRGPVSTIRIIKTESGFILNPTKTERENAAFELIVSGKNGNVNMIEGKSAGAKEEDILTGIEEATKAIEELNAFQNRIQKEIGKEKMAPEIAEAPEELKDLFKKEFLPRIEEIFAEPRDKKMFYQLVHDIESAWMEKAAEFSPDIQKDVLQDMLEQALDTVMHKRILEKNARPDGRALTDVRALSAKPAVLPRIHGSGLFFRGDTHILSVVTLGPPADELLIDTMGVEEGHKRFMHHYNFPPFSVGETGRMGAPGRREIGHGALAEKALLAVIPDKETFPYTIRIVSETLSSNGSSSMGSVSASSVALMDAGVPISEPVAGIAMGVVIGQDGTYKVLTDIQGPEDHYGDMDLKVAGTKDRVTAIQMDVKVEGVSKEVLADAFHNAKKARGTVLETITAAISEPRKELSPYAPRVIKIAISPDKIRDVIGPGGKTINAIIDETGADIDIEQDGTIFVSSANKESLEKALQHIELLTKEFAVGERAEGKVTRIFPFGAMVEIAPHQEGLVHISELAPYRVGEVTDIVDIGDTVPVKITGIDELGRINLSIKEVATLEQKKTSNKKPPQNNTSHNHGGRKFGRAGAHQRRP